MAEGVEFVAGVNVGGEGSEVTVASLREEFDAVIIATHPDQALRMLAAPTGAQQEILSAIRRYEGAIVLVTHDEGAVAALDPDRVLLLPDGDEDLWGETYLDLVSLA